MSIESMMHSGLEDAVRLLKLSKLFLEKNTRKKFTFSPTKFSPEFIDVSQESNYIKIWTTARERDDYDILLKDGSILQFSYNKTNKGTVNKIRYAYYETPKIVKTYDDFLNELGFTYEDCGDELYEEYQQSTDEQPLRYRSSVTPLRYDYDIDLYKEFVHPISHLHIGHHNQIKIPCQSIVSPNTFVGFIIRHIYYKYCKWSTLVTNDDFFNLYSAIKINCIPLEKHKFTNVENYDLNLM